MKPHKLLPQLWNRLPPQTWPEIYAAIIILLFIFLIAAWLIDVFKGSLP